MTGPTKMVPLKDIQKLLQRVWGNWNIHAIVMASLGFQCVLEFLAPLRKTRKKGSTHLKIWSAYLLADYFATFGIALINSNAEYKDDTAGSQSSRLEAFWAPFLFLHLGGPHAITSFDIEDNNLWHRQLLTLIVQTFAVLLVFYRYKIYTHRCLTISSGIVFFAGIVKYAERTHSLYLASVSHMRRSMLESSTSSARAISHIDNETWNGSEEPPAAVEMDDLEIVHRGYMYYQLFKGFILDHAFFHIEKKLEKVKKLFLRLENHDTAYKVLEVELNFMYDSMFTKMAAVQWISSIGYAYRFAVHVLLVAVAITFYFCDKSGASNLHVSITYILLGGAVVLDFVALGKLVCSEWTVALMMEKKKENENKKEKYEERNNLRNRISGLMRDPRIMKLINAINTWVSSSKRWSEEIRQYSLINHSAFKRRRWQPLEIIIKRSGLIRERLDAWQYTTIEPVGCHLLKRVFEAIKNKAEAAPETKSGEAAPETKSGEASPETKGGEAAPETKGGEAAPEIKGGDGGGGGKGTSTPSAEVHQHYDNCVVIWHVATEICYFTGAEEEDPNKKLCRNISEYLVYFLVMEGKLTSTVPGNIGLRFKDICWEEVRDTINELEEGLSNAGFRRPRLLYHINSIASAKLHDFKDAITLTNWRRRRNNNNATAPDTCDRKRTRWEKFKMKWEYKKLGGVCNWLLNEFEDSKNGKSESDDVNKSVLPEAVNLGDSKNGTAESDDANKSGLPEAVNLGDSKNGTAESDDANKSVLPVAVKLAKDLKNCCRQDPKGTNNDNNFPCRNPAGNNQIEQDVENPPPTDPNRPDNNVELEKKFWENLSHVWIELLLYGASHCRDDIQYLNKGGELLTFVRLLMVHFGLREAFRDEAGSVGFKLEAELKKVIKDEKFKQVISKFLP